MNNPVVVAIAILGFTMLSILMISMGILFDAQDDYMRMETKNAASIKMMCRIRAILLGFAIILCLIILGLLIGEMFGVTL